MTFFQKDGPVRGIVQAPEPTQAWGNEMERLSKRLEAATKLYNTARDERDRHVVVGRQAGYTTDRMAYYAGVSQARVSQIVKGFWKRHG